jgi:hypothetical protein
MEQNANDIRRMNLQAAAEAEAPVFNDDQATKLNDLFFQFNNDNITSSVLLIQEDEEKVYEWVELMDEVNKWFNGILRPFVLKQVPILAADGTLEMKNVKQPYLNQIQDMQEVSSFHERAKLLEMHQRNLFRGVPFGLYTRLNNLISMRDLVLKNHKFCLSKFKQFLWRGVQILPRVEKGDACFNHLNKSINQLISTGLFLRKYRSDLTTTDLGMASDTAVLDKIIDMTHDEERQDYVNCEMSIFVEPELNKAERYLHDLITNQQKAEQALAEQRKTEAQKAGRYLRSKNNKRVNKLSKKYI